MANRCACSAFPSGCNKVSLLKQMMAVPVMIIYGQPIENDDCCPDWLMGTMMMSVSTLGRLLKRRC